MTNQEVIEILLNEQKCLDRNDGVQCDRKCESCDLVMDAETIREAYSMAISALQAQDTPDTNVGGTVSRQAAIDATWFEPNYTDPLNVLTEVRDRLKALPSAQPEIIHCRDCKHHHYDSEDIPYCDRIDYGYGWKDDDYCSMGEKENR